DIPPSAPTEPPESADGLFTSEELFGDLVDAPLEPKPDPARAAAAPIRVQVNENGEAGPPKPKAADVRPEDMSALLDAFGPAEPAPAKPAPISPLDAAAAEESVDAGALLSRLSAQPEAAPEPEPAATPSGSEPPPDTAIHKPKPQSPLENAAAEDVGGLLDALGGGSEEPPPAPTERTAAEATDTSRTLAPGRLLSPFAEAPAASGPPAARPPERPPTDLDSFLDDALSPAAALDSETRARSDEVEPEPVLPTSRLGTKFQAAEPKIEAQGASRVMIDLGALAEDALSQPIPPRDKSGSHSGVGDVYGPYTLLERIATGGMAEVFKAKRTGVEGFEKVVAVKRILHHLSDNKEFVEMFIDEAKVVAGLGHPNIVQIFDLGKLDETYFIAMEYVHGRDLRTILRRAKDRGLRVPLDLAAYAVSRVCAALDHAHKRKDDQGRPLKIVHRDVSPQNILISFEGDVKLTDFGIAKAAHKATSTDKGALRGKLLYMSPEQASGLPMDRRSDVFSVGIVLYEMITDRKPFMGTSEKGILDLVRECQIDPPSRWNSRVPERLERIAMRALAKDPQQRFEDAGEMHRDLERALLDPKPPTAQELARLMEVLFEREERGVRDLPEEPQAAAEDHAPFEMDFDDRKDDSDT
ncbi:MAG TPA: serine/threonine-protein kinase, partial [Vicinamibacteria bacterium]|nr:serine/threonine-protein kinase [Vicinamibacteria bacterium]